MVVKVFLAGGCREIFIIKNEVGSSRQFWRGSKASSCKSRGWIVRV